MITTVTVNQWHIKHNETCESGEEKPVMCVNRYMGVLVYDGPEGLIRMWGPKIGDTEHHDVYDVPAGVMRYDPINKTPCGASCWMEFES